MGSIAFPRYFSLLICRLDIIVRSISARCFVCLTPGKSTPSLLYRFWDNLCEESFEPYHSVPPPSPFLSSFPASRTLTINHCPRALLPLLRPWYALLSPLTPIVVVGERSLSVLCFLMIHSFGPRTQEEKEDYGRWETVANRDTPVIAARLKSAFARSLPGETEEGRANPLRVRGNPPRNHRRPIALCVSRAFLRRSFLSDFLSLERSRPIVANDQLLSRPPPLLLTDLLACGKNFQNRST